MIALDGRSPFHDGPPLRNIMTGMHAGERINVDDAKTAGNQVMTGIHAGERINVDDAKTVGN